jgi:hypothetical protein
MVNHFISVQKLDRGEFRPLHRAQHSALAMMTSAGVRRDRCVLNN